MLFAALAAGRDIMPAATAVAAAVVAAATATAAVIDRAAESVEIRAGYDPHLYIRIVIANIVMAATAAIFLKTTHDKILLQSIKRS